MTAPVPTAPTWLLTTDGVPAALLRALAGALLDDDARLVLAGTSPADLTELADLPADRVRMVVLDPADDGGVAAAVRTALDVFGRLDVVVTGPGTGDPAGQPAGDVPARVAAGIAGTAALAQAALPVLRRQGRGALLHLAPETPASPVDRAALRAAEGYLEALHDEVLPLGVRVTVAGPTGDGDPVRTARVLVDVVADGHAPLHLPLGAEALRHADRAARARLQELDVWAEVSRSTDRADAPVRASDRGMAAVLHLAAPLAS